MSVVSYWKNERYFSYNGNIVSLPQDGKYDNINVKLRLNKTLVHNKGHVMNKTTHISLLA